MDVEPVPMPARVQTPQRQAWITAGCSVVHLNIHPTHGGKHVAIGAMRLVGLDLKDPPEQILVGLDPQEGLIDYHEARQL